MNASKPWSSGSSGRKSKRPSGRAMNPSTLMPTNTVEVGRSLMTKAYHIGRAAARLRPLLEVDDGAARVGVPARDGSERRAGQVGRGERPPPRQRGTTAGRPAAAPHLDRPD